MDGNPEDMFSPDTAHLYSADQDAGNHFFSIPETEMIKRNLELMAFLLGV